MIICLKLLVVFEMLIVFLYISFWTSASNILIWLEAMITRPCLHQTGVLH